MFGTPPKELQISIFEVALESFIDMNHELVLLSKQIDWEAVESEFAEYYCAENGLPSVPIRMLLIMAVSLYTSRVVLNTLGVEDYGIYSVLGAIVPMFAFLNRPMVTSTQRCLTFESGKELAPNTNRTKSRFHKD